MISPSEIILAVVAAVFVTAWVCSKLAERDARRERDAWRRVAGSVKK